MTRILIKIIYCYQRLISPLFPPKCRFEPTCSQYAVYALEYHGGVKGCWLIVKRLFRCHPYTQASSVESVTSIHE